MIYTSYFGKIKSLPKDATLVAICGRQPEWFNGYHYKKLAPKYDFFIEWKKNQDNDYYIKCFNEQVLSSLSPQEVINDLTKLGNSDIILLCYEKSENFCHRHLVREWLNKNNIECEEWK
jgi:uncharacterized protein YeaO (DUF488 family)